MKKVSPNLPWKINMCIVPIITFIIALSGINRYHENSAELHALLQEKQKRMTERLESNLGYCMSGTDFMAAKEFIFGEIRANRIIEGIFILKDDKVSCGVIRNKSGEIVPAESVLPESAYRISEAVLRKDNQDMGTVRLFITQQYLNAELRIILLTIIAEIIITNILLVLFLSAFLQKIVVRPLYFAIEGLNNCAAQIGSAGNEILSASYALASGTFEQAESTRQTYFSLTEIYDLCKRNAQRAERTNHLEKNTNRHILDIGNCMDKLNISAENPRDICEKMSEFRKAFSEVSENAAGVGSLVAEIVRASEEQVEKIGHIRKAVGNIDEVAQQNSAISEQCSAASELLNEQVIQMKVFVETLSAVVSGRVRR